jgi:uncharacterized protein
VSTPFPVVERDDASAEFFDAAARGELVLPGVGPVSGAATLVSWVVVHRAPLPALAGAVPYVSAVVELAEGPWLLVRLVDADPSALRVGAALVARYVRSGTDDQPGETLPVFAPV